MSTTMISDRLGGGMMAGDVKVEIWLDWEGTARAGGAATGARRLRLDDSALWVSGVSARDTTIRSCTRHVSKLF